MERKAIDEPLRSSGKAWVLGERSVFEHRLAEAGELPFVLHAQEHIAPVAGAKRTVGRDRRVVRARAWRCISAKGGEIGGEAHPFAQRFEHRDVERGAFT